MFYPSTETLYVQPGRTYLLNTNLKLRPDFRFRFPNVYCQLKEKSSNNFFQVLAGVIDPDYTGKILVKILPYKAGYIEYGSPICQALFLSYNVCDTVSLMEQRNELGFGQATNMVSSKNKILFH